MRFAVGRNSILLECLLSGFIENSFFFFSAWLFFPRNYFFSLFLGVQRVFRLRSFAPYRLQLFQINVAIVLCRYCSFLLSFCCATKVLITLIIYFISDLVKLASTYSEREVSSLAQSNIGLVILKVRRFVMRIEDTRVRQNLWMLEVSRCLSYTPGASALRLLVWFEWGTPLLGSVI